MSPCHEAGSKDVKNALFSLHQLSIFIVFAPSCAPISRIVLGQYLSNIFSIDLNCFINLFDVLLQHKRIYLLSHVCRHIIENYRRLKRIIVFNVTTSHDITNNEEQSILDFIKGHNDVSIKDIVPNITGCSEKTVQRELISLIKEGKIKKIGERRWSKYSIAI